MNLPLWWLDAWRRARRKKAEDEARRVSQPLRAHSQIIYINTQKNQQNISLFTIIFHT